MESMGTLGVLAYLGVIVLLIVSIWKIFEKAGKPGWAAIVPIYNMIVLLEIVNKPVWWIVLMVIPFVNIVIAIIVYVELAKAFGKSAGFGIGMIFLSFIFLPLLAFGEDQYLDGTASSSGGALDSDLV
ncbi:MAG: DUF5684 domain-containing protein [Saprospiraceae bacterium]|nr:DUF5684 domain-containing protein [Saprospiraceae bacterium]